MTKSSPVQTQSFRRRRALKITGFVAGAATLAIIVLVDGSKKEKPYQEWQDFDKSGEPNFT